jgi:hypothetical protein
MVWRRGTVSPTLARAFGPRSLTVDHVPWQLFVSSVNLIRVYRDTNPDTAHDESVGFTYLGGKHYDVFIIYT